MLDRLERLLFGERREREITLHIGRFWWRCRVEYNAINVRNLAWLALVEFVVVLGVAALLG
jgi:hypothetical protein